MGMVLTVSNLIEGLGLMEMIPEVGEGMIFNLWMGRAIENRINCKSGSRGRYTRNV